MSVPGGEKKKGESSFLQERFAETIKFGKKDKIYSKKELKSLVEVAMALSQTSLNSSSALTTYNIQNLCEDYENSHITAYFRGRYQLLTTRGNSRTTSLTGKWAVKYSEMEDYEKNKSNERAKTSSFQYEGKSVVEIEQSNGKDNGSPIFLTFDYGCSFSGSFNMIEGEKEVMVHENSLFFSFSPCLSSTSNGSLSPTFNLDGIGFNAFGSFEIKGSLSKLKPLSPSTIKLANDGIESLEGVIEMIRYYHPESEQKSADEIKSIIKKKEKEEIQKAKIKAKQKREHEKLEEKKMKVIEREKESEKGIPFLQRTNSSVSTKKSKENQQNKNDSIKDKIKMQVERINGKKRKLDNDGGGGGAGSGEGRMKIEGDENEYGNTYNDNDETASNRSRKSTTSEKKLMMPESHHRKLVKIMWDLWNLADNSWFIGEPPSEIDGIPYSSVVTRPMWLEYIWNKLDVERSYTCVQEFVEDMTVMYTNALEYNEEGTPCHEAAKRQLDNFVGMVKVLQQQLKITLSDVVTLNRPMVYIPPPVPRLRFGFDLMEGKVLGIRSKEVWASEEIGKTLFESFEQEIDQILTKEEEESKHKTKNLKRGNSSSSMTLEEDQKEDQKIRNPKLDLYDALTTPWYKNKENPMEKRKKLDTKGKRKTYNTSNNQQSHAQPLEHQIAYFMNSSMDQLKSYSHILTSLEQENHKRLQMIYNTLDTWKKIQKLGSEPKHSIPKSSINEVNSDIPTENSVEIKPNGHDINHDINSFDSNGNSFSKDDVMRSSDRNVVGGNKEEMKNIETAHKPLKQNEIDTILNMYGLDLLVNFVQQTIIILREEEYLALCKYFKGWGSIIPPKKERLPEETYEDQKLAFLLRLNNLDLSSEDFENKKVEIVNLVNYLSTTLSFPHTIN